MRCHTCRLAWCACPCDYASGPGACWGEVDTYKRGARTCHGHAQLVHGGDYIPAPRSISLQPPALLPRVTLTAPAIAQIVTDGAEFVPDTITHVDDGERLTVTLSGPVRHRTGDRARAVAKVVGALTDRVRGR